MFNGYRGLTQVLALARVCVELSLNVPYRLDGSKYDRFELVVAGFADAQNYVANSSFRALT